MVASIHRRTDGTTARLIIALDDISSKRRWPNSTNAPAHRTMGHISATIATNPHPLASPRAVQESAAALELPDNKKILLEIVLSESDRLDRSSPTFCISRAMRPPGLIKTA